MEKEVAIPLALFIKEALPGKCTGISVVDSTPPRVCKNRRIHIHKTFRGIARRGKCSMGRFFGLKLHLICDEHGALLNFMITHGDVDGIQLITKLRNNMKGALMSVSDKLLLWEESHHRDSQRRTQKHRASGALKAPVL